jgi:hypothetical protein
MLKQMEPRFRVFHMSLEYTLLNFLLLQIPSRGPSRVSIVLLLIIVEMLTLSCPQSLHQGAGSYWRHSISRRLTERAKAASRRRYVILGVYEQQSTTLRFRTSCHGRFSPREATYQIIAV